MSKLRVSRPLPGYVIEDVVGRGEGHLYHVNSSVPMGGYEIASNGRFNVTLVGGAKKQVKTIAEAKRWLKSALRAWKKRAARGLPKYK